jgi:RNA polymerase subunit RPABC4/transcription elongation factor Spt4
VDFLSKIKSGASEVGRQAQVLVEVNRLNAQISEKRSGIQNRFRDIGQDIYEQFKFSGTVEFKDSLRSICLEIRKLEAEIDEITEKITQLKGVKQCPKCSKTIETSARFCPNCGATLEEPQPQPDSSTNPTKSCPNCSASVVATAKFCPKCGNRIQE